MACAQRSVNASYHFKAYACALLQTAYLCRFDIGLLERIMMARNSEHFMLEDFVKQLETLIVKASSYHPPIPKTIAITKAIHVFQIPSEVSKPNQSARTLLCHLQLDTQVSESLPAECDVSAELAEAGRG